MFNFLKKTQSTSAAPRIPWNRARLLRALRDDLKDLGFEIENGKYLVRTGAPEITLMFTKKLFAPDGEDGFSENIEIRFKPNESDNLGYHEFYCFSEIVREVSRKNFIKFLSFPYGITWEATETHRAFSGYLKEILQILTIPEEALKLLVSEEGIRLSNNRKLSLYKSLIKEDFPHLLLCLAYSEQAHSTKYIDQIVTDIQNILKDTPPDLKEGMLKLADSHGLSRYISGGSD